jgi:hypothetical protein
MRWDNRVFFMAQPGDQRIKMVRNNHNISIMITVYMDDISIDGCDYFTDFYCKSEGFRTSPLNSFTESQSLKVGNG